MYYVPAGKLQWEATVTHDGWNTSMWPGIVDPEATLEQLMAATEADHLAQMQRIGGYYSFKQWQIVPPARKQTTMVDIKRIELQTNQEQLTQ